jgi:hypothetical protein
MTVDLSELGREAVRYATAGFYVFPIAAGGKTPPLIKGWERRASNDPGHVEAWWRKWPDANIGVVPDLSGHFVLDIDVKGNKRGLNDLAKLENAHAALPETLTISTPSGGEQRWFRGSSPTSADDRDGLDFRGGRGAGKGRGYGLLPPSRTPAGVYTIRVRGRAVEAPAWLIAEGESRVGCARALAADPDVELDTPAAISSATAYLKQVAPKAVDGEGGDARTYIVAEAVRDLGLSEGTCLGLMLEHYNPRCDPPWEDDELAVKVANAYRYAQNEAGCRMPEASAVATFAPALEAAGVVRKPGGPVPFRDVLKRTVAPVAELIPGLVEKGVVTFLAGPGGVHKSRLALQWGLCLDAGAPIFGRAVERATFVYLSCEDHPDEVARRAQAITARLQLPDDGGGQFWDLTGEDATLAAVHESGECEPLAAFDRLRGWLQSIPGHKFVVVDSTYNVLRFEGSAKINEGGVKAAIALLQRLCDEADCTLLVLWHPSQAGQDRGDASGWSVAWHNAPRARLSITAADKEGDAYTLATEKRNHGPKGKPITLHWSAGALLPLTEVGESEGREALIKSAVRVAIMAAEAGAPIQATGKRLYGWQLNEIEEDLGRRPAEREVKEALAASLPRSLLRYVRTSRHRCAGYYPPNEERARELAVMAKRQADGGAND